MTVFTTGNSGGSTGPHLDFRVWDVDAGSYIDPRPYTGMLQVGGKPLVDQFGVSDGYGMRTHPIHGDTRMHHGIDYLTPSGTQVSVPGASYIGTTNDSSGGGITSQYGFLGKDGRKLEILLMHGDDGNKITSDSFITSGGSYGPTPKGALLSVSGTEKPDWSKVSTDLSPKETAKMRTKAYSEMSKAQLDSAYDALRSESPAKAAKEGLAMHKAYFGK